MYILSLLTFSYLDVLHINNSFYRIADGFLLQHFVAAMGSWTQLIASSQNWTVESTFQQEKKLLFGQCLIECVGTRVDQEGNFPKKFDKMKGKKQKKKLSSSIATELFQSEHFDENFSKGIHIWSIRSWNGLF